MGPGKSLVKCCLSEFYEMLHLQARALGGKKFVNGE